ncbi:zinc-ribbon domain-containing protein [Peribacillus butanolivorans]|uniref:zinc-ribbon domain-containing protein n=1 Tax=Peribacillus butanolivorans TaxID=421767 RepID=UPI00207CAB82|nr:zinc-ribbon domain-containing protein [Peribacillus butanolivorans]MCO0601167.1 zinc-ribbon domain-containing protein [Peribacillus butanolivorans]
MERNKKKYLTDYPHLLREWHPSKNEGLNPQEITHGSSLWIWWQCEAKHEWKVQVYNRTTGKSKCPYCIGKLATRENCLMNQFPNIAKEWDSKKNIELSPYDVTPKSGKKVWWECHKGHSYQSVIADRTYKKSGCSYCSGKLVDGTNNLAITHPHIAKEWHPTKNGEVTPFEVTKGKRLRVWWKANCGHEWEAYIYSRTRGNAGCPFCNGKKTDPLKSIQHTHPSVATYWHPVKNKKLKPSEILPNSNKKVWWRCPKGHEWQTMVVAQTNKKNEVCPACAKQTPSEDYSLATERPLVAEMWHPIRNGILQPNNILPNSEKKVWWQCKFGHEWESKVYLRKQPICPKCSSELKTSYPEQFLYYFMKKVFPKTLNRYYHPVLPNRKEIDIFVPEYNFAIEYDGFYSHNNKEKRDEVKNEILTKHKVLFVRVRENRLNMIDSFNVKNFIHEAYRQDSIIECLFDIFDWLQQQVTLLEGELEKIEELKQLNFEEEYFYILSQFMSFKEKQSLAYVNPSISQQWHLTNNKKLKPAQVFANSRKRVWWQCEKGHEWQEMVFVRTKGVGCPFCSNRRVDKNNSLQATHSDIAREWHPTNNGNLSPNDVTQGSKKKVWWKAECGHEWEAVIYSRKHAGCPYCSGKKVDKDNSLANLLPNVAREWHPTKNGYLTPNDVTRSAKIKVWWKCPKGDDHEWEATVNHRGNTHKPTACPFCSGRYASKGYCLSTVYPHIAKYWDEERNGELTPFSVTPTSGLKVWWKCKCGESYERRIADKVRNNGNCGRCRKSKSI